jgi:hypothetical protein
MALTVAARAGAVQVTLDQQPDKAFEVTGSFTVDASSSAVWVVLTDYEHIPDFVSSMKRSVVRESRPDGSLLVEQEAVGGMFFVSKKVRVLLDVHRTPGSVRFDDIDHRDFWIYSGGWTTAPAPAGILVSYHLLAQPDFPAPSFLLRGVMRRGARDLLMQVRAEIVRRAAAHASR